LFFETKDKAKSEMSREEFFKFKQDLVACLNPNFLKRLLDLEQKIESAKKDNFVNVLVKRLQRLIHLHNWTSLKKKELTKI
jgi:hypothetical protein